MGALDTKVWDVLMRLVARFDPQNPNRSKSLSSFWFGPRGCCTEMYCFVAANWNVAAAREVIRHIAAEMQRWYGFKAGSPRRMIHSFKARNDTGPTTL